MHFVDVEEWLNGWEYSQEGILHNCSQESCVGCGYKFPIRGTACYVITGDEPEFPRGFPFNMQNCPLCKLRNRNQVLEERQRKMSEDRGDVLTRRLEILAKARQKQEESDDEVRYSG